MSAVQGHDYRTKPTKMMVLGLVSAMVLAHGSPKSWQTICEQATKYSPHLTE